MKWKTKLSNWKKGGVLTYPKKLKYPFIWLTSVNKDGKTPYKQEFVKETCLSPKQDYSAFQEYIKKSKNKYVLSFWNLSGDTILIIPTPKQGKNYAHLKNFIDNASNTQQKVFWKEVARIATQQTQPIWISTHGLGVPYLHVRIDFKPKYYHNSKLKKA